MRHSKIRKLTLGVWIPVLVIGAAITAQAQSPKPVTPSNLAGLRNGDYVAVIGDSITEQRIYSVFIADYLLMCRPARNLGVSQFGWSGDWAKGFVVRMSNDCLPFQPSV